MKNKTAEQLAEEYAEEQNSAYTNDYYGFLAGFRAKEEIIEETLDTLCQLVEDISKLPLTEQLFKSRDLDRLNSKIEIIQSLL